MPQRGSIHKAVSAVTFMMGSIHWQMGRKPTGMRAVPVNIGRGIGIDLTGIFMGADACWALRSL
jgi:hypothetical protein